jgi:hypothetical protein
MKRRILPVSINLRRLKSKMPEPGRRSSRIWLKLAGKLTGKPAMDLHGEAIGG